MATSMLEALLDEARRADALSVEALRLSLVVANHTHALAKQIENLVEEERAAAAQASTADAEVA